MIKLSQVIDQLYPHDVEIERLRAALAAARIEHYSCDDGWYSCPKSENGCLNSDEGDKCNCGADAHNAKIDSALAGPTAS